MSYPVVKGTQQNKKTSSLFILITICLINLFSPTRSFARTEPTFAEISIYINIPGMGGRDMDVVIKDKEAYLPIAELFGYLKIKTQVSSQLDAVSGFFINPKDVYVIDKKNNRIQFGNKTIALTANDLIQTTEGLYLRSKFFGEVFGLDCVFDFRSLSASVTTKLDLPVLREKRQELMRQNINKLKNDIIADTTIKRTHQLFNIGTADWSVGATQTGNTNTSNASLRLGAVIAGGETTLGLNYQNNNFDLKQQNYLWHYVDNDNKLVRQISVGKVPAQSTSTLLGPVNGMQITNASTTFRKSMGAYTLSDITNPDWTVELYINNVLVDYLKADASGFFSFQVPMVYGTSALQLRFFGPYGEEQTKEQNIIIPYSFLPKGETEYVASNGIIQDNRQSRFSRTDLKYGLSNRITIGSGMEYLSSITKDPFMPFVNASYRATSNLYLSGDYTHNVRTNAIINYKMPSDLLLEINYTKFKEGQEAIAGSALENYRAILSRQFKKRSFNLYTRLAVGQLTYSAAKQTTADLLLSSTWRNMSANLTTNAIFINKDNSNVYSNLSLSFRLPLNYTLRPQVQYNYNSKQMSDARVNIEKRLFGTGSLDLAFANNFIYKTQTFTLGLHFDLSFAKAAFSAIRDNHSTTFSQSFSGGAVYDKKASYFKLNNLINVGKAGLLIYPYLDLNGNNKRDANEPKVAGLQLKINGGRMENSVKDTVTRVLNLEPFTNYILEVNPMSFDNIAWQMKNTTYKITTDPNQLKLVEIPVQVFGEVSGTVSTAGADSTGIRRIRVNIYRNGKTLVKSALTEEDGYFNFLGLPPGSYTASLDETQLGRIQMKAAFTSRTFIIKPTIEGDVVKNIDFRLTK